MLYFICAWETAVNTRADSQLSKCAGSFVFTSEDETLLAPTFSISLEPCAPFSLGIPPAASCRPWSNGPSKKSIQISCLEPNVSPSTYHFKVPLKLQLFCKPHFKLVNTHKKSEEIWLRRLISSRCYLSRDEVKFQFM